MQQLWLKNFIKLARPVHIIPSYSANAAHYLHILTSTAIRKPLMMHRVQEWKRQRLKNIWITADVESLEEKRRKCKVIKSVFESVWEFVSIWSCITPTKQINRCNRTCCLSFYFSFIHMMFLHMEYPQCEHFKPRVSSRGGNIGALEGLFLSLLKCHCEKQM